MENRITLAKNHSTGKYRLEVRGQRRVSLWKTSMTPSKGLFKDVLPEKFIMQEDWFGRKKMLRVIPHKDGAKLSGVPGTDEKPYPAHLAFAIIQNNLEAEGNKKDTATKKSLIPPGFRAVDFPDQQTGRYYTRPDDGVIEFRISLSKVLMELGSVNSKTKMVVKSKLPPKLTTSDPVIAGLFDKSQSELMVEDEQEVEEEVEAEAGMSEYEQRARAATQMVNSLLDDCPEMKGEFNKKGRLVLKHTVTMTKTYD